MFKLRYFKCYVVLNCPCDT